MNNSFREIIDELLWLRHQMEDPDQEVDFDLLERIQVDINDKLESIAMVLLDRKDKINNLKGDIKRLQSLLKTLVNEETRLKHYTLMEMQRADMNYVRTSKARITAAKLNAPLVEIVEPDAVDPKHFKTEVVTTEKKVLDKDTILANFEETGEVPEGIIVHTNRRSLRIK